ncbi:unnamed protein product [Lupinus luteus]|uniref:Uncharacterized protein n=1 Tax=Lupinus luteus TaxID=3873 RepID=A0AAV1X209_LUPLU
MAFTLLFMKDRKKPKHGTDELSVVKAAAWAWYQRGSGSESKAVSVFDASRNHRAPRPSRYKLEALLKMEREAEEASSIHTNQTLLDAYEIESISRHLDNFIELESKQSKVENGSNTDNGSLGNGGGKMKMKKIRRPRHGGICGTLKDVFDINAIWCGHKWLEIGPPRIGFR